MQYLTQVDEIREAIAYYTKAKTLWLDTEVADYQTNPKLSLIQILDDSTNIKGDRVSILDILLQPELVAEFISEIMLNPKIEKVFHNAKYDLNFLGKRKAKNVTCTLEMVKKIPYYLAPLPNHKLKTLAEQLCHFPCIDKTEQGGDWGVRPLSKQQLDYAKMDPVYLAQVHHRLLQLTQLIEPNPETDNVDALTLRYQEIEHHWRKLDTEVKHIKERLKKAMDSQNITEIDRFQLSSQKRTSKTVTFTQLMEVTQDLDVDIDFPITLTKTLQKELGEVIEQLPIEEEIKIIWQLKVIGA